MGIKKIFGENVKRLRKKLGFSQEGFAQECGVHRTYMGLIERGEANVSLENIERIAKKLKVLPRDLI